MGNKYFTIRNLPISIKVIYIYSFLFKSKLFLFLLFIEQHMNNLLIFDIIQMNGEIVNVEAKLQIQLIKYQQSKKYLKILLLFFIIISSNSIIIVWNGLKREFFIPRVLLLIVW